MKFTRSEESFNSVWQILSATGLKIKKWLTNSPFELREARAPRQTPLRRLQALVGEHAQRRTQLTPESHHRINTYYASIDKVLSELELRLSGNGQEILCALENICKVPAKRSQHSTQHIPTLLGATCCARLATLLRHVACCWLKFEAGEIWANNTQHVATNRNTVAKHMQHVAPNNVATCVGMLRSFGRGLRRIPLKVWAISAKINY